MYFPTPSAHLLRPSVASAPTDDTPLPASLRGLARLGGAREDALLAVEPDSGRRFFVALTPSDVQIWSIRPRAVLARLVRNRSDNLKVAWHGDSGIVVLVSEIQIQSQSAFSSHMGLLCEN
jgi:hypothetical protein